MTEKIIEYRTVSSPNAANKFIKYFENKYIISYDWRHSNGEVEDAVAVCVLETESGRRFVTTTSGMKYIESRTGVKNIGSL